MASEKYFKVIRVLEYRFSDVEELKQAIAKRGVKKVAATFPGNGAQRIIEETCITPIMEIEVNETELG